MIKVVLIDIDDALLSFSAYVKEAMRDGFSRFGLKPYKDDIEDNLTAKLALNLRIALERNLKFLLLRRFPWIRKQKESLSLSKSNGGYPSVRRR